MKNKSYDKKIFRLIYILNKLDSGEKVTTQSLAQEFNVSLRTVQRDIVLLDMAGFPLICLEKGVHSFVEGFSLKKMKISGEEASLLSLLYDIVKELGSAFENPFRNILRKVISEKYDTPFYVKIPEGVKLNKEYSFLNDLERAIDDNQKIMVRYKALEVGKEEDFKLRPLKIIFYDGFWYLLSQTDDKNCLPKFRLENIKKVKVLDEYFEPPENLKTILDESVNIWFSEKRDKKVILEVNKDASKYFRQRIYFPLQKIAQGDKDGSLVVECWVDNYNEVIPTILRWIQYVNIIEPKELREEIKGILLKYLDGG